jgi:SAM-dependent methyltransferase
MLTVDYERLRLHPGDLVLDLGCGAGRHTFEAARRGAHVVALDRDGAGLKEVMHWLAAMWTTGELSSQTSAGTVRGDANRLPFPDGAFDAVIAAEVLEHLPEDRRAIGEVVRVLRPGGVAAVTVPRWWPERICWALSESYHTVEGGHVRIYHRRRLMGLLRDAGLRDTGHHYAHALHSPYWWLRCLSRTPDGQGWLTSRYHRLLVYDLVHRPRWTRWLERLLNPVLGKSLVVYLVKPGPR